MHHIYISQKAVWALNPKHLGQILAFQNLSVPQSFPLENGKDYNTCIMQINTLVPFKDLKQYLPP